MREFRHQEQQQTIKYRD